MDCIVHGVAKSWTQLSDFPFASKSQGPQTVPAVPRDQAPTLPPCTECSAQIHRGLLFKAFPQLWREMRLLGRKKDLVD